MEDFKDLSISSNDDLSVESKMMIEELIELQTSLKSFYQTDIREYFKTEGIDDVKRLKRSYDNEIAKISNNVLKNDIDNLLYNLFGETFFMD